MNGVTALKLHRLPLPVSVVAFSATSFPVDKGKWKPTLAVGIYLYKNFTLGPWALNIVLGFTVSD